MQKLLPAILLFSLSTFNGFAHEGVPEQVQALNYEIQKNPKSADLYLKRGELQRLERDWEAALADYATAYRLDPELHIIEFCRGRMYYDAEKYDQAVSHLDQFLQKDSKHIPGHLIRARSLTQLKQPQKAMQDYELVLQLSNEPKPEYFIESAQTAVALNQPEKALKLLDSGITAIGPIVTLQLPAIDLELQKNNFDGALKRVRMLSEQSERKETWLAREAEILVQAGRHEEAKNAYARALAAIAALPPHLRKTKAMISLEQQIQLAVSRKLPASQR